ncbi:MAG: acyl-CoA dehydrogenase family protein [Planctomycetota bacterium]
MSAENWHNLMLSEEETMIRDMSRKFAEEVLDPQAVEIDRDCRFPVETFEQMAELGLLGLPISEEMGGGGMGYLAYCIALEEIAKKCGSTALGVEAHISLCTYLIDRFANEEQRRRYVPDLASGRKLGSFGLTEPGAGSDAGGTKSVARRDGGHFVLNGRKAFITNANHAGTFVVTARTDNSRSTKGISAFIVERETPGLVIEKGEEKLGMRGSDWANLVFEDMRIPVANRIGEEGEGFAIFMKTLDAGRVAIAALALGLAEGAYEHALDYAKERKAFGKPLAAQQAVAFKLAEMATRIEASRHLVYHGGRLKNLGQDEFSKEAAIAKIVASECATFCADEAIQIHGGYGYVREYHVERIYRDAKLCEIGEGTSEICRLVISRQILG